jgi:flavin-dependent dehydrogenase
MESVSGGWLFLIPRDALTGCVVGCGAPLANLLEESLLIGPKVELGAPPSSKAGAFRSFPRIRHPLAGDDWIACGSAAMSLDPISGSGTGHAACEGILAAAALKAIATGEHPDGLLNHYRARLMAAFHRHLEACIEAHQSARHATRWADELALLNTGLHWTRRQVASIPQSSYVLRAMDLVAVPATRVTSST